MRCNPRWLHPRPLPRTPQCRRVPPFGRACRSRMYGIQINETQNHKIWRPAIRWGAFLIVDKVSKYFLTKFADKIFM